MSGMILRLEVFMVDTHHSLPYPPEKLPCGRSASYAASSTGP